MIANSDIESMSVSERLQMIELIWNSIRSDQSLRSPEWHNEVLQARRAKVEAGEGQFLSISELRRRLNQRAS